MLNITTIARTAAAVLAGALVFACETTPADPIDGNNLDTTVVRFENMRPDSAIGGLYVDVDSIRIVAADSPDWDVRLPYILCCGRSKSIPVRLNSGTNGAGQVTGAVVAGRFETITALPSGTVLRSDDSLRPIVPLEVIGGNAFFVYDFASHTLQPSPDKTLIVRTAAGRFVKLGITSIYENATKTPTLDTPIGFYHFRVANIKQ